jgi:aminopeptidase N
VFDLKPAMELREVALDGGAAIECAREGDRVIAPLPAELARDETFRLVVRYSGSPEARNNFDGFHWQESADGRPWIGTSCQGEGAHSWWPCKASYYHPEDKPERISVELVVPAGLYGVSNGRLQEQRDGAPGWFAPPAGEWTTFEWRHPYPLETYSVTLNVAPYEVVEQELRLPGLDQPLPFIYYVLPEDREKADLQFQDVPALLTAYSNAFGPFPFPDSKFGLVETPFWGMEHSTAVAYGSSFPAWCRAHDEKDRFGRSNRFFDYILIHEVAHEWWGNAVSAEHWGHFWIHEGFGTYAEGVYLEHVEGRAAADRYFEDKARGPRRSKGSLYRGDHPESGEAYTGLIYSKGACVLNTLRHYVDDESLREFNLEFRYGNASTEDFQAVLERNTGREWGRFFDEWFYGSGVPALTGTVRAEGRAIELAIDNTTGSFHVPLDLAWTEKGERVERRVWLDPGSHELTIECGAKPEDLELVHLDRVLGNHRVQVVR